MSSKFVQNNICSKCYLVFELNKYYDFKIIQMQQNLLANFKLS